ncbi:hypothetical protein [Kutzneria kofuensis]|uniref:3-oxoacyl-(Acyl-carrier-protein) synthase n=1 Tax=Kutzneria kofuensis TaxID=103725 RepID=A0A7W9KCT4_9PSEU|nr:hypothetical protein [Kutzneria kofuensis]MBB5890235.1 3-oxoacyl-(acyl-carrier-protein) synthase [Kutzneria kofuensis]
MATGRLAAGGASLDLAAALLSLHHQVIPPTVNVDAVAERHRIDLVTGAPRAAPSTRRWCSPAAAAASTPPPSCDPSD